LPFLDLRSSETLSLQQQTSILSNQQENLPNVTGDDTEMKTVAQGVEVINEGQQIRVVSSRASKETGNLNKVNPANFYPPDYYLPDSVDVVLSADNTFLDDNLYLEIGLEIKNLLDAPKEIYLSNFILINSEQENMVMSGLQVTNLTNDAASKDRFKIILAPEEKRTVFLGYVVSEEQVETSRDALCIIPDIAGISAMDPELVYMIKLNIETN
jgi:hypothetical protein